MAVTLTRGFAASVFDGSVDPESTNKPILQVLSVKKINAGGPSDRYRVILSDGEFFCQAMLATQLNHLVEDQSVDKHVVVRLSQFVANSVQGRRLIIILGLEVQPYSGDRIGHPVNVESAEANGGVKPGVKQETAAAAPAAARGAAPSRAPPARTGGAAQGPIFPIEALSPYSNKWTIKARVALKSDIKHYSNAKGDGKLFNVTFIDESGEIRATGFNETVDNLFEQLQEGKVYFISKGRVNIAKKQFSNVKNDYEIMFERDTEVSECEDASVPQIKFDFKPIDSLTSVEKDEMCDVIGIVREVHDLGSITSKASNKPFSKRDIQLVDQTGWAVRLTLWGKQAEQFSADDFPVMAFKGVKVGDFGGRSLSMFSSATMTVNPDIDEAHALRGWYDATGANTNFQTYSNSSVARTDGPGAGNVRLDEIKTIGQVKDEGLGTNDKVDYFTVSAVVSFIKHETFSYPACANPDGCNKKVVDEGGGWRCEKCEKTWESPIHRYIVSINIMDHTSSIWTTAFNDTAEAMLGISANELIKIRDSDEHKFQSYFQNVMSKTFTFQMMAKQDNYGDQPRVRYNSRKINTPDYAAESKYLAQQIEQLAM